MAANSVNWTNGDLLVPDDYTHHLNAILAEAMDKWITWGCGEELVDTPEDIHAEMIRAGL